MDNHPNINCWFCGAEQTDLVKRISELEAERSELRNKVIEECLWYLGCNSVIPLDESQRQILNSLKTK